jgi:FkbM family methyltransferase
MSTSSKSAEATDWLGPAVKNYLFYFGSTPKPVIWEVGSRDGRDAVDLARRIYDGSADWFWDNARIVALEPNPVQAEIIRVEYPEIEVLPVAVSDVKGSAPFVVYEGDEGAVGSSSLRLDWKEGAHPEHRIKVKTDKLDNLVGDTPIDIMKIDVEGHSVEALYGFEQRLKQVKVFHIETEKWTDSNIRVKAFMMGHGFMLVDETEQYSGMPDQVWVRG